MAQKTINNIWASLSTNRVNFSEDEVGVGILYKGAVVSNQLNGLAYDLYSMVDFIQRTGGLYNSAKRYQKGDVVSILRKDFAGPLRVEQYRCIAENGAYDTPPILNAVYDADARIPSFQGGQVNKSAWARCDVVGAFSDTQERADFSSDCIKLFSTHDVAEIDTPIVKASGEYRMAVYFNDKVTSFTINLEGSYTKKLDGSVIMSPNRLGIPAPEIYFKDVRTDITDYGAEGDFHKMMPFGVRFEYSNSTTDGAIYLRVREGVRKISITGHGTFITMNLGLNGNPSDNFIIIPIRSGGGFEAFDSIGTIESKDFHLPIEMQYKMGLYKLRDGTSNHYPQNNMQSKDSPLWGADKTATSGLFSYLAKIKGSWSVPRYVGAFLRNMEENLIPGQRNVPARVLGSYQNDAIRNITAECHFVGESTRGIPAVAPGNIIGAWYGRGTGNIGNGVGLGNNRLPIHSLVMDASRQVPTSHDIHPYNVAVQMYYKAF